ncbi:MAG: ATP-dependent helicase [Anaerolineales bacterium]|nr:MAG: ATP-dependent helicase [Anaerolineales bacterium]
MIAKLSDHQRDLIERPVGGRLLLAGPAGTGKTTTALGRLRHLVDSGVPAGSLLVVVPQRTLGLPYEEAVRDTSLPPGGRATVSTVGGVARRMVSLFWPMVSEEAGFAWPNRAPTFLTLETSQYYMARLVGPLLDQGYFETITIGRNRLYGQVLDNLKKAAVVRFPHTEIGERLKAAWSGEETQNRIYDEAQDCASRFRVYCLAHNLLDFSLQLEVFLRHLWTRPECRRHLMGRYRHLIIDNIEEDTPASHGVLGEWLPQCESAFVISDDDGGYRTFLGADPETASDVADLCDERVDFTESFVSPPELRSVGAGLARYLGAAVAEIVPEGDPRERLVVESFRYYPEMLDWVAAEITRLVRDEATPATEIAILAPFLPDSLRFSLRSRLAARGVPVRSHRPSRALKDEPAARCLLTLGWLAHDSWGGAPSRYDVTYALMQAIEGLDLVRAHLLTKEVYQVSGGTGALAPFDQVGRLVQQRVTFVLGERYERLRSWVDEYASGTEVELDFFLSRLFGEVLSQAGFGFHSEYDAGQVVANLIESVRKFRWVTEADRIEGKSLGREYAEMVRAGVIAAQYIGGWRLQPEDAVLLAPAYTFLMANRPVDYQFWLDVGSRGWWERLHQPLTHPYVLSHHWPRDRLWTDGDEEETRRNAVAGLTLGLVRRCRRRIYLPLSELGEQGFEQKGPLLRAVQRLLRQAQADTEASRV